MNIKIFKNFPGNFHTYRFLKHQYRTRIPHIEYLCAVHRLAFRILKFTLQQISGSLTLSYCSPEHGHLIVLRIGFQILIGHFYCHGSILCLNAVEFDILAKTLYFCLDLLLQFFFVILLLIPFFHNGLGKYTLLTQRKRTGIHRCTTPSQNNGKNENRQQNPL